VLTAKTAGLYVDTIKNLCVTALIVIITTCWTFPGSRSQNRPQHPFPPPLDLERIFPKMYCCCCNRSRFKRGLISLWILTSFCHAIDSGDCRAHSTGVTNLVGNAVKFYGGKRAHSFGATGLPDSAIEQRADKKSLSRIQASGIPPYIIDSYYGGNFTQPTRRAKARLQKGPSLGWRSVNGWCS